MRCPLSLSGQPGDDRCERVDRGVLDDLIRDLPPLAAFFQRRDDVVLTAHQTRGREPGFIAGNAERTGDAVEYSARVMAYASP